MVVSVTCAIKEGSLFIKRTQQQAPFHFHMETLSVYFLGMAHTQKQLLTKAFSGVQQLSIS